jgi:multidrug efflux system outer membrane protein
VDPEEPALRQRLAARSGLPRPAAIAVDTLPARLLAQRPDIAAAERALQATNAEIGYAEAQRYPSISLSGSAGRVQLSTGGSAVTGWSLLPAISLPLFDGGVRRAEVKAAEAAHAEAYAAYRQAVRDALKETERALVRLDAAARRETGAAAAARDYERYVSASDDRFKLGSGSLFELEDARRSYLGVQLTLLTVQQDRVLAWIALYKAVGGGWQAEDAHSLTTIDSPPLHSNSRMDPRVTP